METLKKKMTKKEQQELLLRETKKTLQKELSPFKRRKILTSEELIKMKEASQMWDERIHMRKKLTPLEELQFEFYRNKEWLLRPVVENMIIYRKPGPYDQSIKELECFNISVPALLWQNQKLEEERDSFHNQVHELEDQLISSLKKESQRLEATVEARNATLKEQNTTIEEESYRIRHCADYNEDMEAQLQEILSDSGLKVSSLRVV